MELRVSGAQRQSAGAWLQWHEKNDHLNDQLYQEAPRRYFTFTFNFTFSYIAEPARLKTAVFNIRLGQDRFAPLQRRAHYTAVHAYTFLTSVPATLPTYAYLAGRFRLTFRSTFVLFLLTH